MVFSKILHIAAAAATLMASLPISLAADSRLRPNRGLQSDFCLASPIEVIDNTTAKYIEDENYFIVTLQEPMNRTNYVDVIALDMTADLAYNSAVDCSLSRGSIRSLTNCTTILENVTFAREALLMKCEEYASNSIDGSNVLSSVNLYTNQTCNCTCGTAEAPGTSFLDMVAPGNDTCPCSCTGSQADCVCYAPYVNTVLDNWNDLYQNQTDAFGRNVSIIDFTSADILKDCNISKYAYNATAVCIPNYLITEPEEPEEPTIIPVTANPTKHPTKKPTKKPTRRPTRRPTKKPTRRPTRHPTSHPTTSPSTHPTSEPTKSPSSSPSGNPSASPTAAPTASPSDSPTSSPSLPPSISSPPTGPVDICKYLKENGFVRAFELLSLSTSSTSTLCSILEDLSKQFTVFVTSDGAYDALRASGDYSFTPDEWADKWNEILGFSIIEGKALPSEELACPSDQHETLQGESISTLCEYVVKPNISLLTEMITRKFQYGDCNLGEKPLVLKWYEAANGIIIELTDVPLPDAFNDCSTAPPTDSPAPSESPTMSPTGSPSASPTTTVAPTESAYPTEE